MSQVLERSMNATIGIDPSRPRRFRWPIEGAHPNGTRNGWRWGCYFPLTDLVVTDMGERGTGAPSAQGLQWLDDPPPAEVFGPVSCPVDRPFVVRRDRPGMDEMLGRPEGL